MILTFPTRDTECPIDSNYIVAFCSLPIKHACGGVSHVLYEIRHLHK